jgi:hypothetical protein
MEAAHSTVLHSIISQKIALFISFSHRVAIRPSWWSLSRLVPQLSISSPTGRALAQSSTGTVFVRVNGRPSTADQVVRYLISSTAAELHPTQCRKRSGPRSTSVHKFSFHVTVVILLILHIPQWRILMYEAYVRIHTTDPI